MSLQLVTTHDFRAIFSTTKTRKNETTKNGPFVGNLPLFCHFVPSRFRGEKSFDLAL